MIDSARRVTGLDIPIEYGAAAARRSGDPLRRRRQDRRELGWSARYTEIDAIVATAWNWFQHHPTGYGD